MISFPKQKRNIKQLLNKQNTLKLSENQKESLEGEITYQEASTFLKNMKNNKSPGSDGFTAELF